MREVLQALDPPPTTEAQSIAASLHKQMMAFGRMHDLFEDSAMLAIADESGQLPPFEIGEVMMGKLNRGDLTVPIFQKFFKTLLF